MKNRASWESKSQINKSKDGKQNIYNKFQRLTIYKGCGEVDLNYNQMKVWLTTNLTQRCISQDKERERNKGKDGKTVET